MWIQFVKYKSPYTQVHIGEIVEVSTVILGRLTLTLSNSLTSDPVVVSPDTAVTIVTLVTYYYSNGTTAQNEVTVTIPAGQYTASQTFPASAIGMVSNSAVTLSVTPNPINGYYLS